MLWQLAELHFRHANCLVHDFWIKLSPYTIVVQAWHQKFWALAFLISSFVKWMLCGIVFIINMNTDILTQARTRNFKTFPKENYPIASEPFYIFTKKCWIQTEDDVDNACTVCIYIWTNIPELKSRFNEYLAFAI